MVSLTNREECFKNIRKLAKQYFRNREQYENIGYKEDELRREYIDRFFKYLGWDVYNEQGFAEQYKEVVSEASIKIGGTIKSSDLSFRIGGVRIFFVEVKKPAVKIKNNKEAAYQLRRYAWNAKLPISILTNFREIAVYDCRIKPSINDKSSVARIEYLTLEYLLESIEKFFDVFSKNSVLKGSFDKYSKKGGRGTSEVDEEFLKEIESWREKLAKNIATNNKNLTVEDLNYVVQAIINRIVFLRIEEDRHIEKYGRLMDALKSDNIYEQIVQFFQDANEKYNAGLFDLSKDKLTQEIKVDNSIFEEILSQLYYPESPYDFAVIGSDILGGVYEKFLEKVIRLTSTHRAKIETKVEVKKAGGVFYTPEYVAKYIVKRTVGEITKNKTPRQVKSLKILDPACGSGTFLLEAYQNLLEYHLQYYLRMMGDTKRVSRKQVIVKTNAGWKLTTEERKRILLNNIFGVDVDPQAVEVTKLNLLLKCLEGENLRISYKQLKLKTERILPNIDNNIRCGNSLVTSKILFGQTKLIKSEKLEELNPFDYDYEFKEIMDRGGFDCIIGNPPYIRIQRIPHQVIDFIFENYLTPFKKSDISLVFIEKAHSLLKQAGILGFICSSQWMSTDYGEKLREYLSKGFLKEIVNFGSLPVFSSASTYPAIFIISKKTTKKFKYTQIVSKNDLSLFGIERAKFKLITTKSLGKKAWSFSDFNLINHLKQNKIEYVPLSRIGHFYIGALTGMDSVFVITEEEIKRKRIERGITLPYAYRGAEINSFENVLPKSRIIYPYTQAENGDSILMDENFLKETYPRTYKYLLESKDKLKKRLDSRKRYALGKKWFSFLRPGRWRYITNKKLLIKGVAKTTVVGYLGKNTAFNGANCPGLILNEMDSRAIMGVLNSKLITHYLRSICPPKLQGYRRFNANSLNKIPIPIKNEDTLSRIVVLSKKLMKLKETIKKEKTPFRIDHINRQIKNIIHAVNDLVFELYCLSSEEKRTVINELKEFS